MVGPGPDRGVSLEQVEDHRSRDDGNPGHRRLMASAVRLERPDHPVGGGEPEGAPPGEDDRLGLLDSHPRLHEGCLTRPRRRPAHLGGHDVGLGEDDHSAAGACNRIRPVADLDTRNRSDRVVHARYRLGTLGPMPHTTS